MSKTLGRPRLEITDEERYERHKEKCKLYTKNRMMTDPVFCERIKTYNTEYLRKMREKKKLEQEQLIIKKKELF
jgi:hypothetical protein